MTRRVLLLLLLFCPAVCAAQEKKAPKRSYVGVMIAVGKEKGTFVVLAVIAGGPADRAGLQAGDVIVKIDGAAPPDLQTAVQVIAALKPGRKARLVIVREGKKAVLDVVPAARNE